MPAADPKPLPSSQYDMHQDPLILEKLDQLNRLKAEFETLSQDLVTERK